MVLRAHQRTDHARGGYVALHSIRQGRFRRQECDTDTGSPPYKIVYADIAATDTDARGGEPVFVRDRCIGVTTSGAYGHRVKKSLAFACVDPEFAAPGSVFEVLLQGERRAATVLDAAAFDPDNSRMRA